LNIGPALMLRMLQKVLQKVGSV